MKLNRSLLKEAVDRRLLTRSQAERLWQFLYERASDAPAFRFTHILYYLGGLIAIGAMSLFMNLGLGAAGDAGHLAYSVFKDSMPFPFVLTAIGFGVIYLGIVWQRHERTISQKLRGLLPGPMRELIESRH